MVDIAQLSVEVDTRSVKTASSDLDKLSASAKATATAVSSLESDTTSAASATTQLGTAAASNVVPFTKATSAVNQATKAVNIQRVQMQQLSFQMNDIATGLLSGQSPFMIMAQQGGQVLQILQMGEGGVGGAVAKVGAAIAAVASPATIAVGGILALTAALSAYATLSQSSLKSVDDVLKEHKAIIGDIKSAYGEASVAVSRYGDDSRTVLTARLRTDIVDLRAQIGAATDDLVKLLTRPMTGTMGFGPRQITSDYAAFTTAIENLRASAKNGEPDIRAFREAVTARMNADPTNKALQEVGGSLLTASDNANALTGRLGEAKGTLGAFGETARTAAGGVDVFAQSLRKLAEIGLPDLNDYDQAARAYSLSKSYATSREGRDDAYSAYQDALGRLNDQANLPPTPRSKPNLMDYNPSTGRTYASESRSASSKAQNEAERRAKAYQDLTRNSQQFIETQGREASAIGLTQEAAAKLRYEQELLNKAADQHIELTPKMTAELKSYAAQMAEAETATAKLKDAYDFSKQTFQGFFEDFRSGLANGEGFWKSFASAAGNALDSIASKMLELVTSKAFDAIIGMGAGGGGSAAGGILSMIASLFGFANGGVFSNGHVTAFARGGIVTRPTIFPMARGMGLMGEAGPEAVMPLRRGADGKLGVAAGGNAQPQQVEVAVKVESSEDLKAYAKTEARKAGVTAVNVANANVVPAMARYQQQRRGDWRTA